MCARILKNLNCVKATCLNPRMCHPLGCQEVCEKREKEETNTVYNSFESGFKVIRDENSTERRRTRGTCVRFNNGQAVLHQGVF